MRVIEGIELIENIFEDINKLRKEGGYVSPDDSDLEQFFANGKRMCAAGVAYGGSDKVSDIVDALMLGLGITKNDYISASKWCHIRTQNKDDFFNDVVKFTRGLDEISEDKYMLISGIDAIDCLEADTGEVYVMVSIA